MTGAHANTRCPACGISIVALPCWSCSRTLTVTSFGKPYPGLYEQLAHHIEQQRGTVDVQSVAAQLGTETWTLAMHLAERGITHAHISASDANPSRLEAFRTGRYLRSEVAINVDRGHFPAAWVERFFTPDGPNHLAVSEEVRELVTFTETAHMPEDLPKHADVLMLRRVWRDLTSGEQTDLIDRILNAVPDNGLILAHGLTIPLEWERPPHLFRPRRKRPPQQRAFIRPRDRYKRTTGTETEVLEKWRAREQAMVDSLIKRFGAPGESGPSIARRPNRPVTLYRGATPDTMKGLHWTTVRSVAEYYAQRCIDGGWDGRVYRAVIPPNGIIQDTGVSNGEHHVLPAALDKATVTELPLSRDRSAAWPTRKPPAAADSRRTAVPGDRGDQFEVWRARAAQQVETFVKKYGYRDTPGQCASTRPDVPLVVYRGASIETWNGPYWSPRRETAEGYALLAARAGWDARVFTTTVQPESIIHQINSNEILVHPDTLIASAVEMSAPVAPRHDA